MGQGLWKIPDIFAGDCAALHQAGFPPLLAAVLATRGINTPVAAETFLNCENSEISDPFALQDMDKAVERINRAIAEKESVAVYGDYDVDGITASCLLCDYLIRRGLSCRVYIPDRIDEGYGLNDEALEKLAAEGIQLIVTVDCGITSADNMEFAKGLGLDIIVTDHHECPAVLPDCCAVVDPKREEAGHPAELLAGVGVAMKLACALDGKAEDVLARYCDLVAVGTIADVMPLVGENRALVYMGLEKLKNSPRAGFAALILEAGAAERALTASVVGYTLAPRINAAGRLCETSKAVDLLMCEDAERAQSLAAELCTLNRKRQELEAEVWQESLERLAAEPPTAPIVLAGEGWHPGVVGIAASRIAEEFRLPAIIICLDGEDGKGSCRSWGDFNLFAGLVACSEYLEGFGGHAFAAGINIKRDKIDDFRAALARYWAETKPETAAYLEPELQLADLMPLTLGDVESLDRLEPCGSGNPQPLMCICGALLSELTAIGGGKHLRVGFEKNGRSVGGVFFGQTMESLGLHQGDIVDVCFTPQINEFRSRRNVQLLVTGLRSSEKLALCHEILENTNELPKAAETQKLSRDSLGALWRELGKRQNRRINLPRLVAGVEPPYAESVAACLGMRVFSELGLLKLTFDGEYIEAEISVNAEKVQLENSPLFCKLSQN